MAWPCTELRTFRESNARNSLFEPDTVILWIVSDGSRHLDAILLGSVPVSLAMSAYVAVSFGVSFRTASSENIRDMNNEGPSQSYGSPSQKPGIEILESAPVRLFRSLTLMWIGNKLEDEENT